MVASLLSGLDSNLSGFKDQILASETLPTIANAYSRLLCSSLGQEGSTPSALIASTSESSVLVSGNSGGGVGLVLVHLVVVVVLAFVTVLVEEVGLVAVVIENVIIVGARTIQNLIVG